MLDEKLQNQVMIYQFKINNYEGGNLGIISFSETNQLQFVGPKNKEFEQFVLDSLENGVRQIIAVHNPQNGTITKIEQPIVQNEQNFPLAFKQFLERNGYKIIEQQLETEEKIRNLLASFPDDNADKIDMLKRLPDMSCLEQTIILEGLEKMQSEHQ